MRTDFLAVIWFNADVENIRFDTANHHLLSSVFNKPEKIENHKL